MFGVNVRNVKAARKHLADLGWLILIETPAWVRNRWGQKVGINLAWSRPLPEASRPATALESPPPTEFSTTELPPPKLHQEPLTGLNHQKPTSSGPAGISREDEERKEKPTLRNITLDDLRQTDRLLILFEEATHQALIEKSDHVQLQFVAAAEHALIIGTRNPCGLFAHLVHHRLWHVITHEDEDAANARLKQHFYGQSHEPWPVEAVVPRDQVWGDIALAKFG